MKQVININFQGSVVPIEISAYDILKSYTESLRRHFGKEEGGEEIINDIEGRISELYQERLKGGATCITDEHMEAIIQSIGRPEEFDEEKVEEETTQEKPESKAETAAPKRLYRDETNKVIGGVCSGIANYFGIDVVVIRVIFLILLFTGVGILPYLILWIAVPSSSVKTIGSIRKKFYRDADDKIIGGVCSGIGHYFNINPWIPRVMFLIPFLTFAFSWSNWTFFELPNILQFTFSPGAFLFYIILWMVMPEANTTSEKLEMKGEKVDLESIKNTVITELKGVKDRAEKLGKEAVANAENINVKKHTGTLGNIILIAMKLFIYIILGIIGLSIALSLFALAIAAIAAFPLKDLIIEGTWPNLYAWGTLLFFIIAPVVGTITWMLRRIMKSNRGSGPIRFAFGAMWALGWVCLTMLLVTISKEFKRYNPPVEEEITLSNPHVPKLNITASQSVMPSSGTVYSGRQSWIKFDAFGTSTQDTMMVQNVSLEIVKSTSDSFKVTYLRFATGKTIAEAVKNADMILFEGHQADSVFTFMKGIPITHREKFRNQHVFVIIHVPVGKQIYINKNADVYHGLEFETPSSDELDLEFIGLQKGWKFNTNYIMEETGLRNLNQTEDNEKEWGDKPSEEGGYRYRHPEESNKKDTVIIENYNTAMNEKKFKREKRSRSFVMKSFLSYNPIL